MFAKPKHDPRVERLSRIELLCDCSREELASIARITTPLLVASGTALCEEGTPGDEVFIIFDGKAVVSVAGNKVARLENGDVCGEMALLQRSPRTATVTAVSPLEVLVLNAQEFSEFLDRAPTAARRVLAACSSRVAAAVPLAS